MTRARLSSRRRTRSAELKPSQLVALFRDPLRTTLSLPKVPGALREMVEKNRLVDPVTHRPLQRQITQSRVNGHVASFRLQGSYVQERPPVCVPLAPDGRTAFLDAQHRMVAIDTLLESTDPADKALVDAFPDDIAATWLLATTPYPVLVRGWRCGGQG